MQQVRTCLSPEFANRIDKVILFKPLDREAVRGIIDKVLGEYSKRLAGRVEIELDESAYDLLMENGFDETFGARAMERAVQQLVVEPLGKLITEGTVPSNVQVAVSADGGAMSFRVNESK